jgi:O-antigen ligase
MNLFASLSWGHRARMVLVGAIALSLSLPIAWIGLTRVLLFLAGLGILAFEVLKGRSLAVLRRPSLLLLLLALALFAISMAWTEASSSIALAALSKHGRLLGIFLLLVVIRSHSEAIWSWRVFFMGQMLLCLLSWVAWLTKSPQFFRTESYGVVFTSYLDQSIIFSATAGALWLLRARTGWPLWLVLLACGLMLSNGMLLMSGRTGFLVGLLVVGFVMLWELPKRWRLGLLLAIPLLGAVALPLAPQRVQPAAIKAELKSIDQEAIPTTSIGWRWNAWKRSVQAIAERPLTGHGVGAWTTTVHRLQGATALQVFSDNPLSNPHQEFLLWAVEIGIAGPLLLLAMMLSLSREYSVGNPDSCHAGWLMLAVTLLACQFNSSLFDAHIGDYLCTVLGLALALTANERLQEPAHG